MSSFQAISTKLSARSDIRSEETREVHGGIDLLLNDKMILKAELLKDRTFFLVIQYQVSRLFDSQCSGISI
jgi:hypothetical protein